MKTEKIILSQDNDTYCENENKIYVCAKRKRIVYHQVTLVNIIHLDQHYTHTHIHTPKQKKNQKKTQNKTKQNKKLEKKTAPALEFNVTIN